MDERSANGAPLAGILVLDFSRVLAGPLATMILGDAGARVIKIEEPAGGDPTRGWGPPFVDGEAAYYLAYNRNKESVAVDLKSDDGRRLVHAIAARADVVVENFPVGTAERLGIDWATLSAINPRLVYLSISSFGRSGPDAAVPGYDFLVQAMAGWMSVTGRPDDPPTKAGLPLVDIVTGLHAAAAVTTALYAREKSGRGERIDVSLFGAAVASLGHLAQGYLGSGNLPARHGNGHPTIVPYAMFDASDGAFALAVGTESQWKRLCVDVLEAPALGDDPRFRRNADRVRNREELTRELGQRLRGRSRTEWIERCRAASVPAGPVRDLAELFDSGQARALGLARELVGRSDPSSKIATLAPAASFALGTVAPRSAPPRLGDDSERVREEFLGPSATR